MRTYIKNWRELFLFRSRSHGHTVASFTLFLILFSLAASNTVGQQSSDLQKYPEASTGNWKHLGCGARWVEILFPAAPTLSEQTIDNPTWKLVVHKCALKTFAEYEVMYADYPEAVIKATPPDLLLDEGAKAAVDERHSELVSISPIAGSRYPGRSFKERLPDGRFLRGKMVLVGQRMYRITITTPTEADASPETVGFYETTARKFLDSFAVPNSYNLHAPCPPDLPNCFSGEALTARAISLPQPEYPAIARAARASGTVEVQVLVDEQGNVVSAHAVGGHLLLRGAAVSAARDENFILLVVNDKPVKFTGVL